MIGRCVRICVVAIAFATSAAWPGLAEEAQPEGNGSPAAPASPEMPPVAVGPEWAYERLAGDVHMFVCRESACVPSSKVSYRLYGRNDTMTLEQFRRQQEHVVKVLQEHAPPGTHIEILEVHGDEGSGLPRTFTSRRLIANSSGAKEFITSSLLLGMAGAASLVSSSPDEEASSANEVIFARAVM